MYKYDVQENKNMRRTQIYFEEELFEALKTQANSLGLSLSAILEIRSKKIWMKEKNSHKY